jgi:PBSX family phage terminase large subunit
MRAQHPGAREALVRKHLVNLRETTLRTLLEPEGDLPPVLPLGLYEHNENKKIIRIKGGGEIVYFGIDQVMKTGSRNLTGCGIDEAAECNQEDWLWLSRGIRVKHPRISLQKYAATNPGHPSHFLAKEFGLIGNELAANHECITTSAFDNFFLPKEYLDDLGRMTGMAYQRYVEGRWVGSDRLVYDAFQRETHVQAMPDSAEWKRVILACDEGYTNPAVILVLCLDGDGRLHIKREWYQSRKTHAEITEIAKGMHKLYRAEAIVYDSAAAGLGGSLLRAGMRAIKSMKTPSTTGPASRNAGIQRIRDRLAVQGDGKPRITVDPTCTNTIREFESYENKPDSDDPAAENDHAMDSLRYGNDYLSNLKTAKSRPVKFYDPGNI